MSILVLFLPLVLSTTNLFAIPPSVKSEKKVESNVTLTVYNNGSCAIDILHWVPTGDIYKTTIVPGGSWSVNAQSGEMWRAVNASPNWSSLLFDQHVTLGTSAIQTWSLTPQYCCTGAVAAGTITAKTDVVCASTTNFPDGFFNLSGQSGIVQRWEWSTDGRNWNVWGGAGSTTNPFGWIPTEATFYTRVVVQNGGCTAYSPAKTVRVLAQPIGGSLFPATQTISLTGNVNGVIPTQPVLSGHVGNIVRWEYQTPNSTTWNYWGATGITAPANCCFYIPGTWKMRAIISNGTCEVPSSESKVVVTTPSTLTINNNGACAVDILHWLSTGDVYKKTIAPGGTWSVNTQSGEMWRAVNASPNFSNLLFDQHVTVGTNASETWSVTPQYCCTGAAVGGIVTATADVVCVSTTNFPVGFFKVSGQSGTVQRWEYSYDGTNWNTWNGSTGLTNNPFGWMPNVGNFYTRVVVQNGGCIAYSPAKVIKAIAQPIGGTVSPASQTISLTGNVNGFTTYPVLSGHIGNIVRWEFQQPNSTTWNNWGGTTATAPSNCCFNKVGTWKVRAIVSNGTCEVPSSEAQIVVTGAPSQLTINNNGSCSIDIYHWLATGDVYQTTIAPGVSTIINTQGGEMWRAVNTTPNFGSLLFDQHITVGTNATQTWSLTPQYCCTPVGDPTVFGNNQWIAYAYSGYDVNLGNSLKYSGFYTETKLCYNTADRWSSTGAPSEASGYQGCPVGDKHTVVYKRKGFPCGMYKVELNLWDDDVQVYVNGANVFQAGCCGFTIANKNVWSGLLDANATIEVRTADAGGPASQALCVTKTGEAVVSGTVLPATQTITTAAAGIVPIQHTLSGNVGNVVRWEYQLPNSTVWNFWAGTTTTAPGNCCFNQVGTWKVRAIVKNGSCELPSNEAQVIVNPIVCNLAINITNKTCNNNGTPSNPNDDTYSFSLTVTGGTGSWSGSYNNSYLGVFQIPATPYGTAIQLGPFPAGSVTSTNTNPPITIPSVDISISVRDVQNATCTKSTVVTSTGTCSTAPLLGSIGDLAYCDNNNNSIFDNGDTPQSGVQVQLCNASNVVVAIATTDAQGKYLFPNLAAAIYIIKFPATITGGKTITTTNPITVNLAAGQNFVNADAGYYKAPALGSIGDFVFCDNNSNGTFDTGDTPLSNVTVTLCNADGNTITTTTTDNSGKYLFSALDAAVYIVKFPAKLPDGKTISTQSPIVVNLAAGQNNLNADAGYKPAPVLTGSIGDFVFCDNNNNGAFETGDTPLSNVTVTLCNSAGQSITTAVTNASGIYSFGNLAAATYIVKFPATLADGKNITTQSPITVNLAAGQNFVNADAGYYKAPASNDFCTNPTANVTTGAGTITISGITTSSAMIQIFNGSWVSVFNQTATTSSITVPNLPNGTYYVKVTVLGTGGSWPAKCEKMVIVTVSGGGNNTCADGTPKKTPGTACNDNNPNTTNDVIQADGCGCSGTPVAPNCNESRNNTITKSCVSGKPVLSGTALAGYEYMWISSTTTCAVSGGQPIAGATSQNYYLPTNVTQTTYFSRCARPIGCTEWGAIAESNCITVTPADCGTATGGCDALSVVGNSNGIISIAGMGSYTSQVIIFNSQWQPVFNQQYNTSTATIPLKNGGYIVKIQLYNTNGTWQFVCEKMFQNITVTGGVASLASGRLVLDLTAAAELHKVKLVWANNTGYKNDYFEVEKLNEKSNIFEKIALINSQNGDKMESYTAFDEQPTEGDNIYRINLVGTDGTTKVSNQSVVKFNNAYDFRIFPNPASDYIDVDLKQYEGKTVTLQVYNSFGKVISTQQVERASSLPVHLDLNPIAAGQYLIRVTSEGRKAAVKKFVIQN